MFDRTTAMLKPAAASSADEGRRVPLRVAATADHRCVRFIEAAQRRRAAGDTRGSAAVPHNAEPAVGWFQVRSLEPGFTTAEWGFTLAVGPISPRVVHQIA